MDEGKQKKQHHQQQHVPHELEKLEKQTTSSEKANPEPSVIVKKPSQQLQQDRRPKRKKPGFHDDMFQETSYYFKKGLRYVYPYAFTFTAHIKKRWLGLQVLQLFQREFHMESVEYYENAIKIGKIRVNDEIVDRCRVLTSKDILKTTVHRHEPPVINEPIEFLQNDDEMVVINKPPSIPVHPCGRYRHNTIVFILGKEHDLQRLHTIHRIDRLTSGILMFAKTSSKAKSMEEAVHGRNVAKEYLARVVGEFPSEDITVNEALLTMSHKIGVCQVNKDGKPCTTIFNKLSFNGKSSVVRCKPLTGRMHQIRVHLQWLGYPIVNDPIYNHKTAWGDGKGKRGTTIDVQKVVAELIRTRKDKSYDDDVTNSNIPTGTDTSKSDASNPQISTSDIQGDHFTSVENGQSAENRLENTKSAENHPENTRSVENHPDNTKSAKNHPENTRSAENHPDNTKSAEKYHENTKSAEKTTFDQADISGRSCKKSKIEVEEEQNYDHNKEDSYLTYTSLELGEEYYDSSCTECKRAWKEPLKRELVMYLHALAYKGPGWEYKTSVPEWASDKWNVD